MVKLDRCECVMYLSVPVSRALHTGLPRSNMYPKALTEVVLYLCAPFMKTVKLNVNIQKDKNNFQFRLHCNDEGKNGRM